MKKEKQPVEQGFKKEPFFKRIASDIAYWFTKKGKNIAAALVRYFRSKEVHKLWIRRGIVVLIVLAIMASFKVNEALKMYPYSAEAYLLTGLDREKLTDYNGNVTLGINRVSKFFENVENRTSDAIRMVSSVRGYQVTEDLSYDADSHELTVTTDNRKNQMLDKSKRVKETITYTGISIERTNAGKVMYYFTGSEGIKDLLIAEVELTSIYGKN